MYVCMHVSVCLCGPGTFVASNFCCKFTVVTVRYTKKYLFSISINLCNIYLCGTRVITETCH